MSHHDKISKADVFRETLTTIGITEADLADELARVGKSKNFTPAIEPRNGGTKGPIDTGGKR